MEYYPRKIEEKMEKWVRRKEFILLRGPRQSGKTTLLLHLKDTLPGAEYVTLEDPEWREAFERNPKAAAERVLERGKSILLLDETQYLREAGRVLKLLFDLYGERLKVISTGSGSFDVKVEIGKYLVGRAVYFELMPLTFEEFVLWRARDLYRTYLENVEDLSTFLRTGSLEVEQVFGGEFRALLEEYVIFGGFPAVVKEGEEETKRELLKNLATTYLERDVFYFLGVRELESFSGLLKFTSFNIGGILNHSSICRTLGMDFRTLKSYLSLMRETYIIDLVPPFHRNLTTELRKAKKLYFLDTGLRNSVMNNFVPLPNREDAGRLLENHVFVQLRSRFGEMRFWRTTGKAEVDFVLNVGGAHVPVEVKKEGKPERGFLSFLRTYRPKVAVVFTEGYFGVKEVNGTRVAFLPHYFV